MLAYYGPEWESLASRIVGRWCPSFTGSTGLQLPDTSGFGNHVVLTNMDRNTSWHSNPDKLALSSPGTPNFADIPDAWQLNPTKQIAFSVWCNPRVVASSFTYCLLGKSTAVNAQPYPAFDIRGAGGNTFEVAIAIGATSRTISLGTMIANEWSHLLFSYNGNTLAGYKNGRLTGSLSVTGDIGTTTNPLRLFENPGFPGRHSNALLDDITFYNTATTANEVGFIYEQGRGGGMLYQPPSRRSYYAQLAAAFSILAESGSYALTGQPIPLLYGRSLQADQGSYAYSGTDAATLLGRLLDAGAAAYTLDGTPAGFIASRRISADTVAYLASGLDAGFLRSRVLEAGTGQYVLVASPINITTGTPSTGGAAPYYYLFLLGGSR